MSPGATPLLLLFDIDGTLVAGATEAHARSLRRALHAVHGIDAAHIAHPPSPAGRTDGEIARLLLLAAGVSAARIDERAGDVRAQCCALFAQSPDEDLSHTVIAGMPDLLEELSARNDVRLGLVTGNFEPVARLKLRRAGIGSRFAGCPGGFGSDSEDRAALPGIARRRAGAEGRAHPRERTVVIGDTPRDIACARADGVQCVAVTTGPHGRDALGAADAVAGDVAELRQALAGLAAGT